MKKKVILVGTILISLLSLLIVGKLLRTNKSHAEPTSNKLYDIIKNEAERGALAAKYNGEHNDTIDNHGKKSIYYYTTPIENDENQGNELKNKWNVMFAGKCWQMIRTTDTGGVKLLYNGDYSEENKCNFLNKAIEQVRVSTSPYSLSQAGYMYNPETLIEYKTNDVPIGLFYGNEVEYNDDVYTLIDTSSALDDTHHYTCNTSEKLCEKVRFYFSEDEYVELSNGRTIEEALIDMLSADNVNQVNAPIKTIIDNWYRDRMTEYTHYLEDVIYCNDRTIIDYGGWNVNGILTSDLLFKSSSLNNDLYCNNITDQFSLTNDKAKLTYPIGLPTPQEMNLINNNIARANDSGMRYWLSLNFSVSTTSVLMPSGIIRENLGTLKNGVRPMISLKPGIRVSSGSGTTDDPYIIDENLKYDIITKVNNGTITESITEIDEEATKIIEYSPKKGYQLKSITIDGQEVDINEYPNSYTFGSIDNDHEIKVVFEKASYNIEISKITNIPTDETFNFMFKTKANINGNNEHIKVIKNFVKPVYDTSTLSVEEFIEASKNDNDAENDLAFKVYLAKKENDEWRVVEESKVFPDGWEKQSDEEMQYTYEFGHVNDGSEYAVFESRIFPDKCPSEYTIINRDYDNNSKHYFMDNNEGNITFIYADDEYTKLHNCTENCDNYHVSFDTKHTYIINQVVNNQVEITNDYIYQLGCLPSWNEAWISDFNDPAIYVKKDEDNVYEVSIRPGDKYVVKGMPYETKYELWEEEKEGWKLESIDGEEKTKVENTVSENTTHIFKNVKIEEQEENTPKKETKVLNGTTKPERVKTPLTLDRVLTYVEIAIASLVLAGIMIMMIKRFK